MSEIFMQDSLFVSTQDKEEETKVKIFKDSATLFEEYIKPIQYDNSNSTNFKCYNEYTGPSQNKIKLFLDIDAKNNDLELRDSKPLVVVTKLIENFIDFLPTCNNTSFGLNILVSEQENVKEADLSIFRKVYKSEILKNVSITTSTNGKKLSYHVFFNNIVYPLRDAALVKRLLTNFINKSKNKLAPFIDLQPYKSKPLLRFIYSHKSAEDTSYHYPLKIEYDNGLIEIELEPEDLNETTVSNYLYTDFTFDDKTMFELKVSMSNTESLVKSEMEFKDCDKPFEMLDLPDFEFFTLSQLLRIIFKNDGNLALIKECSSLTNMGMFTSQTIKELNKQVTLEIDYTNQPCFFCKRASHKNKHIVKFNKYGFLVTKLGRSANCKIKTFSFPSLSERQICEWIFSKKLIKRLTSNDLIVFTKKDGWKTIKNGDYSQLKCAIQLQKNYFKETDHKTIDNMKEATIREHCRSLSKTDDAVELVYHDYFKFKNGVLNIGTREFIPIEDSKDIHILTGVNYDYVNPENYNEEQQALYEYISKVIDEIMPKEINGKPNKNRTIFECNISTSIISKPKDIVTVLVGKTSAGKSTMKHLILSSVGKESGVEIPANTYVNEIKPNQPNPWLGKIDYKLTSFASELGANQKINTQTVKLLTESEIQARQLLSNEQTQVNIATHYIDTNFVPEFNDDDMACLRRWAVIHFNTCFKNEDDKVLNLFRGNSMTSNKKLKEDILEGKYAVQFFNIMVEWHHKYKDADGRFGMMNTLEDSDLASFTKYYSNCLINTFAIPNCYDYLKEEALGHYRQRPIILAKGKKDGNLITAEYKYLYTSLMNVVERKGWKVDVIKFLSNIELSSSNRKYYIYAFLNDFKEDKLGKVIETYIKQTKDLKHYTPIDIEYFHANKSLTGLHIEPENELETVNELDLLQETNDQ